MDNKHKTWCFKGDCGHIGVHMVSVSVLLYTNGKHNTMRGMITFQRKTTFETVARYLERYKLYVRVWPNALSDAAAIRWVSSNEGYDMLWKLDREDFSPTRKDREQWRKFGEHQEL